MVDFHALSRKAVADTDNFKTEFLIRKLVYSRYQMNTKGWSENSLNCVVENKIGGSERITEACTKLISFAAIRMRKLRQKSPILCWPETQKDIEGKPRCCTSSMASGESLHTTINWKQIKPPSQKIRDTKFT